MTNNKYQKTHYLILILILGIGLVSFWFFHYQKMMQIWTVVLTGLAYVLWGVIHHYLEKTLHAKLVLEYLTTAVFGVLLILSLLLRA